MMRATRALGHYNVSEIAAAKWRCGGSALKERLPRH